MINKLFILIITELATSFMFKKIKDIKKKIKFAKIWAIIFAIIFISLIINSICLTIKVHQLQTEIENSK
jgi:cell division protein FtsL